jgi:hypothetical protein
MSNLSNIGYTTTTNEQFLQLMKTAANNGEKIHCNGGVYINYSDNSGAELYCQINKNNEFVGMNPHFNGKSKMKVCLNSSVERNESELDGAFYAWADPEEIDKPETGAYPFVFDVPNFKTIPDIKFPKNVIIQLTAFAREFELYNNEEDYSASQATEIKFATRSFVPSGLFSPKGETTEPAKANGIFTGIIKEWELKTNSRTGEKFYWFLVDTLGGEIDVVSDEKLINQPPQYNGILHGQFWLSGKLVDLLHTQNKKSLSIWKRLWQKTSGNATKN